MSATSDEQRVLLDALLARVGAMAEEIVDYCRAELPSFAGVPREEQLADSRRALELVARGTLESGHSVGLGTEQLTQLAARRARQGVRVEELLRAWRISIRMGTERAREIADELGVSSELVIETFQGALGAADQAMTVLAAAHRAAADGDVGAQDDFVVGALAGSLPLEALRAEASARRLDLTRPYRVVRARVGGRAEAEALSARLCEDGGAAAGAFFAGADELAGFTAAEPDRAHSAKTALAVGPAVSLELLPASDRVAARVLTAIERFGLHGVQDLSTAGIYVGVIEAGDVGEGLADRYLVPARAASNGGELIASLRAWLETGRRIEPAAERLHIHPNTLRHRISRYEELVDADLSVSEEIVGLWWALQRDLAGSGAG